MRKLKCGNQTAAVITKLTLKDGEKKRRFLDVYEGNKMSQSLGDVCKNSQVTCIDRS